MAEVIVELFGAQRLGVTYYGNPMYNLVTNDGLYRVSNNSACTYAVDNLVRMAQRTDNKFMVKLHLTKAGRVKRIDRI